MNRIAFGRRTEIFRFHIERCQSNVISFCCMQLSTISSIAFLCKFSSFFHYRFNDSVQLNAFSVDMNSFEPVMRASIAQWIKYIRIWLNFETIKKSIASIPNIFPHQFWGKTFESTATLTECFIVFFIDYDEFTNKKRVYLNRPWFIAYHKLNETASVAYLWITPESVLDD